MTIYKEMYLKLFNAVSKTIEDLQEAQLKCEEMYSNMEVKPPQIFNKTDGE